MARTLDVYLHRDLVGQLIQDEQGQLRFKYDQTWLASPGAFPLSHSLPLRQERFSRRECRGFFGGILPEASQRKIIAKNLGISAENDFAMLEQIGGECAGAVTFIPTGKKLPDSDDHYCSLTSHELAEVLRTLPRRPLLAGDEGVRLSLAGAQDKIAVHIEGDQISIPLRGAPSTHILKPAIERFEGLVFNEALCMRLAEAIGLNVARTEVGQVHGLDYLLVERYDRKVIDLPEGEKRLSRLHQEDFCQALGVVSENKYQNEGGPSLKSCFKLLREVSTAPVIDLQSLLDAVIFNFLIGNHDAHGKNFSLIYHKRTDASGAEPRLAPLYDLLSTAYYPELSAKMAMKLGGEYQAGKVRPKHFEVLAEEAGLAKPMVKRRVPEIAALILGKLADVTSAQNTSRAVAKLLQSHCEQAIKSFGRPVNGG